MMLIDTFCCKNYATVILWDMWVCDDMWWSASSCKLKISRGNGCVYLIYVSCLLPYFHVFELCHNVENRSGRDTIKYVTMYVLQLYWGTKSELGEVVTRLSEVYESAKRDAVTRLEQVGKETVAIDNVDVNSGAGQLTDLLPSNSSSMPAEHITYLLRLSFCCRLHECRPPHLLWHNFMLLNISVIYSRSLKVIQNNIPELACVSPY